MKWGKLLHRSMWISTQNVIYYAFGKYLRKNGNTMKQCISSNIDFKEAYDSVRREALHNILIEFGVGMELARLLKMCMTV